MFGRQFIMVTHFFHMEQLHTESNEVLFDTLQA